MHSAAVDSFIIWYLGENKENGESYLLYLQVPEK